MFQPTIRFTYSENGKIYEAAIDSGRLQIRDVGENAFVVGNAELRESATSVLVHAEIVRTLKADPWPFFDTTTRANNVFVDAREDASASFGDFLDKLGDTTSAVAGSAGGSLAGGLITAGAALAVGVTATAAAPLTLAVAGTGVAITAVGAAVASSSEEAREDSILGYLGELGNIFVLQAQNFESQYIDGSNLFDVGDSDTFISDVAAGMRANYAADSLRSLINELRLFEFEEPFFEGEQFWSSFGISLIGGLPNEPVTAISAELAGAVQLVSDAIQGVNGISDEQLNNTITQYIDKTLQALGNRIDDVTRDVESFTAEGGTESDDLIIAGDGNVLIEGGPDTDTIIAGTGDGTLSGGSDQDTYFFGGSDWGGDDVVIDSGGVIRFGQVSGFFNFSKSGNDLVLKADGNSVTVSQFFETDEIKSETSTGDVKNYSFEFGSVNGGALRNAQYIIDQIPEAEFKTPPPPPPQNNPDQGTVDGITIGENGALRVAPGQTVPLSDLFTFSGGSAQDFAAFRIIDDDGDENGYLSDASGNKIDGFQGRDDYLLLTSSGQNNLLKLAQMDSRWESKLNLDSSDDNNEGIFDDFYFTGGVGQNDFTVFLLTLPDSPDEPFETVFNSGEFDDVAIESTEEENSAPSLTASNITITSSDIEFVPDLTATDRDGQ